MGVIELCLMICGVCAANEVIDECTRAESWERRRGY
jgi:hypothetical protein